MPDTAKRKGPEPKTGDTWKWRSLTITVGDTDPDGRWAMIHCVAPSQRGGVGDKEFVAEWDKQQPLVEGRFPEDWEKVKSGKVVSSAG